MDHLNEKNQIEINKTLLTKYIMLEKNHPFEFVLIF
jgi:hypothetical protein